MPSKESSPSKQNSVRDLSRRERQIMDILYQEGSATAATVMDRMPEAPGYSAVRALMRILEEKGHIQHEKVGPRYVFSPVLSREKAKKTAMKHTLSTFFQGSVSQAVSALLDVSSDDLNEDDLSRLETLIAKKRKEAL